MVNYLVRRWHGLGEDHLDLAVNAPSPEGAARSVAEFHGDKVSSLWGPYMHLHPPILFLIGCNTVAGASASERLEDPNQASIEVYDPSAPPPNWEGP